MKHTTSHTRFLSLAFGLLLLAIAGCTRVVEPPALKTHNNAPDTTRDVRKVLDSLPGFSLFAQAFHRAALDGQLDPGSFYTLFAPTDSAMTAAGLTAAAINNMSIDSVGKMVKYHITLGAVSDTALINALVSIQQNCLLETTVFNPLGTPTQGYSSYRHSLFVKYYGGLLNINGWAVNTGEPPVKAVNGYLYAVHQVLRPPTQLIWTILNSRPELSYYLATLNFMDSIYQAISSTTFGVLASDSVLFNQLRFETVVGNNNNNTSSTRPTVFAPTNTAFINAGFPDIPSIRQYLLNGIKFDTVYPQPGNPFVFNIAYWPGIGYVADQYGNYTVQVYNFFPLDSVLKMQYLYDPYLEQGASGDGALSNLLTYSDLTGIPHINNGLFNVSTLPTGFGNGNGIGASITPDTLQFSPGPGSVLNIQWNPTGTNNATIPQDKDQQQMQRNFWALNGVIYESDRLFFYLR